MTIFEFKQGVNEEVWQGIGVCCQEQFSTPSFSMGFNPTIHGDKVLRLAAELEDKELIRKLATGK